MSTEKPSAFPSVCLGDPGHPASTPGMTLRDWFAGQALSGQLAFSPRDPFEKYQKPDEVAVACYEFADAMLAESAKGGAA